MRLCHLDDVPEGGARGFVPRGASGDALFVVRRGGTVRAWLNACPHHGTPLPWRQDAYLDITGAHIVCAAHGALFDPQTGICTLGPCQGKALTPVPLHTTPDGELHLAAPFQETTP